MLLEVSAYQNSGPELHIHHAHFEAACEKERRLLMCNILVENSCWLDQFQSSRLRFQELGTDELGHKPSSRKQHSCGGEDQDQGHADTQSAEAEPRDRPHKRPRHDAPSSTTTISFDEFSPRGAHAQAQHTGPHFRAAPGTIPPTSLISQETFNLLPAPEFVRGGRSLVAEETLRMLRAASGLALSTPPPVLREAPQALLTTTQGRAPRASEGPPIDDYFRSLIARRRANPP